MSRFFDLKVNILANAGQAMATVSAFGAQLKALDKAANMASVRKNFNQMGSSMGNIRNEVAGLTTKFVALEAAGAGLIGAFIKPAASMEGLRNSMRNLYNGDIPKANEKLDMLKGFALKSAYGLGELIQSWNQFKQSGFENEGLFKGVMNYLGGVGKEAYQMQNVVLGLSQAWSKTKLQGDDIKQLVSASVPVWDILSKTMHKSVPVLQEIASKGKLGREAISMLMTEMTMRSIPMAKNMEGLWTTITSNMADVWEQFADRVMNTPILGNNAGLFDQIKKDLLGITGLLQAALDPKSGKGQLISNEAAQTLADVYQIMKDIAAVGLEIGKGVLGAWKAFAGVVGGNQNALKIVLGTMVAISAVKIGIEAVTMFTAITGIATAAAGLFTSITGISVTLGMVALWGVRILACSTALGLAITAASLVFTGLYNHSKEFRGVVDGIVGKFRDMFDWVGRIVDRWNMWNPNKNIASNIARLSSTEDNRPLRKSAMTKSNVVSFGKTQQMGLVMPLAGARATGGPVSAGRPYLVGERGPEVIVPRHNGMVVPNNRLAAAGGGSGRMDIHLHVTSDGRAEVVSTKRSGSASGHISINEGRLY